MTNVLDWLPYRIISCYNEALMLNKGQMCAPRFAIVYPSYACNHNCIGCDYSELNKGYIMTDSELENVMKQLYILGVKAIEFCGGGEATLFLHLPDIIEKATKEYNMAIGLLTNGTMLNRIPLKNVLLKYASYCRISVEAATEETFNKYKRPKSKNSGFNAVISNIRELVQEKHRTDSKLQISYKFTIDMNNYTDIPKAFPLAESLGMDSLQFKPIRNMPTEMDEKTARFALELIEENRKKYPDVKVLIGDWFSKLETDCWLNPLFITIDPYGDVYICCYYRHRKPMSKHCLGNLFKRPLNGIWYSREHWDKIAKIDKDECDKYDCRFHHYNKLMKELIIDDIAQLQFI